VPPVATAVEALKVVVQVGCVESAVLDCPLTQPLNCGETVGTASPYVGVMLEAVIVSCFFAIVMLPLGYVNE
jgi:hypothetical protein